jgi:hypothetical protein
VPTESIRSPDLEANGTARTESQGKVLQALFISPAPRQLSTLVGFTVAFLPPKGARHQVMGKRIQNVMEVIAFLMRESLCLTCKAHHRRLRLDKKISDKPYLLRPCPRLYASLAQHSGPGILAASDDVLDNRSTDANQRRDTELNRHKA